MTNYTKTEERFIRNIQASHRRPLWSHIVGILLLPVVFVSLIFGFLAILCHVTGVDVVVSLSAEQERVSLCAGHSVIIYFGSLIVGTLVICGVALLNLFERGMFIQIIRKLEEGCRIPPSIEEEE